MKGVLLPGLLLWYIGFFLVMASGSLDPQSWAFANILPVLFAGTLTVTYYRLPLTPLSYVLITIFLTLHTIGSHYTYAQVPVGLWLESLFHLPRNEFDRIVHFCFGLLFALPLYELFSKIPANPVWLRSYLVFISLIGLGGLWEILESWVARIAHPELGLKFLGAQGDVWDAQKDMAATLYGVLIALGIMLVARKMLHPHPVFRHEDEKVESPSCL